MKDDNRFEWINFYMELADKLLAYKDNRVSLIEKIRSIYQNNNLKLPTLDSDDDLADIDPFTIYGLFNKGITIENRITIIRGFTSAFDVKSSIPNSFDGIPVLNNLSATFYAFKPSRGIDDINHLWNLFEAAIVYSNQVSEENKNRFIECYNAVLSQERIKWNITMGLFWIRPFVFINLDSTNRDFLKNKENMSEDFVLKTKPMLKNAPSAEQYIEIMQNCRSVFNENTHEYKSFPELSYYAWKISGQGNDGNSSAEFLRWMNPIIQALRDLGGSATPKNCRNKIIENESLSDEEVRATRGKSNVNKFENEVAFARNYLVYGGYIDKSVHGVWTLTEAGKVVEMTDALATELFKKYRKTEPLADDDIHYWTYAPGEQAKYWDKFYEEGIIGIGWNEIGDASVYNSKKELRQKMTEIYDNDSSMKNSALAVWQFSHDMKIGDVIIVKKGLKELIGKGIVTSNYEFDDSRTDYKHIRKVDWTDKGSWQFNNETHLQLKTLTDVTSYTEWVNEMLSTIDNGKEIIDDPDPIKSYFPYSKKSFLEDVYMTEDSYDSLVELLTRKKNLIIQGAPGVGKTFAAKRLAYSIMEEKNYDRVEMIQFHQSYSYEDFIMGFRPTATGFELKRGSFYSFCKKAEEDNENDYFFIIDEINRGNLSKIFGELFMIIENDKRNIPIRLLYSDEKFMVPDNVYIIGMMNTADRSLAMLDYALRRRFAFFTLVPGFETDGFRSYQEQLNNAKFDHLIHCVKSLNETIANDDSLGEGFCIGHSYFCNLNPEMLNDNDLKSIVEYELIPLLKEYWFDESDKVRNWSDSLRSSIK